MFDVNLNVRDGCCSLCGLQTEACYVIAINSNIIPMSVTIKDSKAHDAACASCIMTVGLKVLNESFNIVTLEILKTLSRARDAS